MRSVALCWFSWTMRLFDVNPAKYSLAASAYQIETVYLANQLHNTPSGVSNDWHFGLLAELGTFKCGIWFWQFYHFRCLTTPFSYGRPCERVRACDADQQLNTPHSLIPNTRDKAASQSVFYNCWLEVLQRQANGMQKGHVAEVRLSQHGLLLLLLVIFIWHYAAWFWWLGRLIGNRWLIYICGWQQRIMNKW